MKVKLTTTLNLLREKGACTDGYRKLLKTIGADYQSDKPINLLTVLHSNGVRDMLWCLKATEQNCDKVARLMAADFAESVLHHFSKLYPQDDRPAKAIQAARDFANGKIDSAAAYAAAYVAYAAADAAADAAAYAAAYAAADAAAYAAADAAAYAAAADAAEQKKQEIIIRNYLKE